MHLETTKINVTQKLKFVLERVENILGKGENAGYKHFSPFPKIFSTAFFFWVVISRDCVVKVYIMVTSPQMLTEVS